MAKPIISRFYNSNERRHTLSFVDDDDNLFDSEYKKVVPTTVLTDKAKTEKSVHFAKENESTSFEDESLSDTLHTSQDIVTWVPSEHLYSEDTFIPETITGERLGGDNQTQTQTTIQSTGPSYGTSTFIDLDTEDETKTESLSSHRATDILASSEVFSSQNGSSLYRSWRDITEIVRDIEDLEESEFVTPATNTRLSFDEADATEADDSFEEQLARHEFIERSIYCLLRKDTQSPESTPDDSLCVADSAYRQKLSNQQALNATEKRNAAKFCKKALKRISRKEGADGKVTEKTQIERQAISPLYQQALERQNLIVEHFGLNSSIMDKLRLENLRQKLNKKSVDLDKDIERSESFINSHKHVEEENARKRFLSHTCTHVLRENMADTIQAHLIKMHPVKCFAELVSGLPDPSCDVREILYQYKMQLKSRGTEEVKE